MWQQLMVFGMVMAAALYVLRVLRRWLTGIRQSCQPGASAQSSACRACGQCAGRPGGNNPGNRGWRIRAGRHRAGCL